MDILENVVTMMEANMPSSSNDTYIKDGLLYCKNCDTPLETILNFGGAERKVRCICKCEAERIKEEERQAKNREKQREIENLQKQSLLGERYKNANFKNTKTGINDKFDEAFRRCKNYCEVSSKVLENGYGLYIYGDKGTGKTHLTACMINELINQYRTVLFTNFFEISKIIREAYNKRNSEEELINKITSVDFLFIDDIGTEVLKKNDEDTWLQGVVFDVINKRYNNKKPTIFTSNHSIQELISQRGFMPKTVDRIIEMSSLILKIEGKSFRIENRKSELPF